MTYSFLGFCISGLELARQLEMMHVYSVDMYRPTLKKNVF